MSLHAGQIKKVIARTNNYSKSDSGKGSRCDIALASQVGYNQWLPPPHFTYLASPGLIYYKKKLGLMILI